MTLHREGTKHIIISFLLAAILVLVFWYYIPIMALKAILSIIPLVLLVLIIWFFRLPSRNCPGDKNIIYAPADGKIVVIEKTFEDEYFNDERIQVSIFMSPLNVHVNTYPQSGTVSYTKYHKGKYLVAWHPKSSTENERSTVVLKNQSGKEILIRQIAGAVARRICTYSKPGLKVEQGGELGFIKFGSRVDLLLPLNAEILCEMNQKSVSKMTPIARISDS